MTAKKQAVSLKGFFYRGLCCKATLEPPTAGAGDDIEPWLQSERGFNGRGNQVRLDVCEKVEKDREREREREREMG